MRNLLSFWSCLIFFGLPNAFAVSRLKLNSLRFGLYPNSRMLTNVETYVFRDTVALILQSSLMQNSLQRSAPNEWPGITYVGLERILENSLSPEGVAKVAMDGLVYFFVPRDDTYIPDNEEFTNWVRQEILTADVLLESLKTTKVDNVFVFQNLTHVAIWEDFYETHSIAPTGLPSVAPSIAPTVVPTAAPTVTPTVPPTQGSNPTTPLSTSATSGGITEDMSTLLGAVAAGAICLLLILLLWGCRKRSRNGKHPLGDAEKPIESSPNNKTVCSDDEESSIQVRKTLDHPTGTARTLFGDFDNDLELDQMSSESFDEESFEEDGFGSVEKIQPSIIVPKRQESFQQRVYNIQKDMLESSANSKANTARQPKSLLGLPPMATAENNCVLKPTDVSAATLAEVGLSRQVSIRSDSSRHSYLVPKAVQNLLSRDHKEEEVSSAGGSNFSGWDPDDTSSIASEDIFFSSSVPNPAEQSLLQHSLRNESYKMQRLRTPEQKKNKF
jgi:hypothetical protein